MPIFFYSAKFFMFFSRQVFCHRLWKEMYDICGTMLSNGWQYFKFAFFWWYLSLFLCRFLFLLRFIAFYFAVFPLMSIAKLGWALSSGLSDTLTQILNLLANKQSSIQLKTTFMSPTTIIWTQDKMMNVISKLWFGYLMPSTMELNGPKQARKLLWPTHS